MASRKKKTPPPVATPQLPQLNNPMTPQTIATITELSKQLNTDTGGTVSQALALLKMAQGRKIVLNPDTENLQITQYAKLPAQYDPKK